MDSAKQRLARPVHLVVAVHGLWGDPDNLDFVCNTLIQEHNGLRAPAPDSAPSPASDLGTPGPTSRSSRAAAAAAPPPDPTAQPRLVVLNSTVNRWVNTYDGIDWCAERVIREIDAEIDRIHAWATPSSLDSISASEHLPSDQAESTSARSKPSTPVPPSTSKSQDSKGKAKDSEKPTLESGVRHTVTHFSIIGYSLGGVIARYVIGALYARGFFSGKSGSMPAAPLSPFNGVKGVVPMNFVTLATPHIGIPPSNTFFGSAFETIGKVALGRTGRQLYCGDTEWVPPDLSSKLSTTEPDEGTPLLPEELKERNEVQNERPLLEAMADPQTAFMKGLTLFRTKVFYGSAKHDLTVPFRTSIVEMHDPFKDELDGTVQLYVYRHGTFCSIIMILITRFASRQELCRWISSPHRYVRCAS